jgi:hypothetical protein
MVVEWLGPGKTAANAARPANITTATAARLNQ